MMSGRRTSGRKPSGQRIRELILVLSSLSHTGERISVDALAHRLGIDVSEASAMMEIVCQASGEESRGLLISANDDFTEFTLQYPGIHGRPIRLTKSETIALVHALDLAEVPDDDPVRTRLRSAFSYDGIDDAAVRSALGARRNSSLTQAVTLCARSLAESRMLNFAYQGIADAEPHERCALVRNLRLDNNSNVWYADSYDLDRLEDRSFRLDRMQSVTLGPVGRLPEQSDSMAADTRYVEVCFFDPSYVTLLEWPGLRITFEDEDVIRGTIPYYGKRSDWLPRRVAACAGTLHVTDEGVMSEARKYARTTLSDMNALPLV